MRRPVLGPLASVALASAAAACGGHTSQGASSTDGSGQPPAAPAAITCASFASPSVSAATRAALFTTLVTSRWSYSYCGSGSCSGLTLGASGDYSLTVPGAYSSSGLPSPRDDSGRWNFAAFDDTSGVVCFDGAVAAPTHDGGQENLPSVLYFKLPDAANSYLQIGGYSFQATTASGAVGGSADGLPNVAVSPGFAALVGASWTKTNSFDVSITPDAIVFDKRGAFTATFGSGCPRSGFVSYDRDTLIPQQGPVTGCAGGPYNYGAGFQTAVVPGFFDDLVVLGQGTYRRSDVAAGKPNAFVFDPYGHSVRVTGTYDGALKAGAATTISLTLENTDQALTRTLGTFSATMQPATVTNGQALTSGALVPLGTVDLGGATLAPGAKTYATISVTPPAAGDTFAFAMRLTFSDATKKYDGGHTFLTAVSP